MMITYATVGDFFGTTVGDLITVCGCVSAAVQGTRF